MDYDLVIIGAGWAGFNAALTAKKLGLKVALAEKEKVGGTCLNRGCIPTKAMLYSAKLYNLAKKSPNFGLEIQNPKINFSKVQERKNGLIQQLQAGMQSMLKGIDFYNSEAKILSPQEVELDQQTLRSRFILLATGSCPMELKDLKFDGRKIISSDEALNLKEIPASLLIIGGGVIGCEFASLFSSLGTAITIAEKMPQLLPNKDLGVARRLENIFKKRGIKVNLNTDAETLNLDDYELVLLCVGRIPLIVNLGLQEVGVKLENKRLVMDEYMRTSVSGIYAAGDCTAQIMLAHFAAYQGRLASENISSPDTPKKVITDYIPECIFTDPEIALIGLSEEEAKKKGPVKVNRFDFMASGMAHIIGETEGFIKVISERESGLILGASIIGPRATELIGIFSIALFSKMKISHIRQAVLAHPTISECITEALSSEYAL